MGELGVDESEIEGESHYESWIFLIFTISYMFG